MAYACMNIAYFLQGWQFSRAAPTKRNVVDAVFKMEAGAII